MPLSNKSAALRTGLALTLAVGLTATAPIALAAEATQPAASVAAAPVSNENANESTAVARNVTVVYNETDFLDALSTSQTIQLGDSFSVSSNPTIPANAEIVLDLNGQTLDLGTHAIQSSGSLTVQDSTAPAEGPSVSDDGNYTVTYDSGRITSTTNAIQAIEGGSVVIQSGTVIATGNIAVFAGVNYNDGTTTEGTARIEGGYVHAQEFAAYAAKDSDLSISGGVLDTVDNAVVGGNGTNGWGGYEINITGGTLIGHITSIEDGYVSCGVYHPNTGTLNISGGTIISTYGAGIVIRGGDTNITGGTIIALGDENLTGRVGDSRVVVGTSGVVFDLDAAYPGAEITDGKSESTVTISDEANISGSKSAIEVIEGTDEGDATEQDNIIVSGGSFSSAIPEDYCAEGFKPVTTANADGQYVVALATNVIRANETNYNSFEEMFDALDGEENINVQLLADNYEDVDIPSGANVTIDLNGHTLTNVSGHTIVNNGTLSITDNSEDGTGTVDCVTHGHGALVNYGNATIESGMLTRSTEAGASATNNGGNSWYVIDNHGEMTFEGGRVYNTSHFSSLVRNLGTMTVNAGEFENPMIALKNDETSGSNVVMTINGGTITGGDQAVQNWSTAHINGGTFNGMVTTWNYAGNTGTGETTIGGTAVVNGNVLSVNYDNGDQIPSVTINDGTINGSLIKGTYSSVVVPSEPSASTSIIVVSGGSIANNKNNQDALPYYLTDTNVAKVETNTLEIVPRSNLGAGNYIVAEGEPAISESDLRPGLEVEFDEETGQYVVSEPDRPVTPPSNPSFDVTVDQPANGTITVSPDTAKEGDTVTITLVPDTGFELAQLTVADEDGDEVELTANADGPYSFEMPAGDVTIHASFADTWENPFSDVDADDWFYEEVRLANLLDLMHGYPDGTFGPFGPITREEAATVMWNLLADGATAPLPPDTTTSTRTAGTPTTSTGRWRTASCRATAPTTSASATRSPASSSPR